jgi:hypothetical protein
MLSDHLRVILSMFNLETHHQDFAPIPLTIENIRLMLEGTARTRKKSIFSSIIFETEIKSVKKLKNLNWEKLMDENTGLFLVLQLIQIPLT